MSVWVSEFVFGKPASVLHVWIFLISSKYTTLTFSRRDMTQKATNYNDVWYLFCHERLNVENWHIDELHGWLDAETRSYQHNHHRSHPLSIIIDVFAIHPSTHPPAIQIHSIYCQLQLSLTLQCMKLKNETTKKKSEIEEFGGWWADMVIFSFWNCNYSDLECRYAIGEYDLETRFYFCVIRKHIPKFVVQPLNML